MRERIDGSTARVRAVHVGSVNKVARRFAPGAKWTDLHPVHGERHFEVVRTLDGPDGPAVELVAVLTGQRRVVTRAALDRPEGWRVGW